MLLLILICGIDAMAVVTGLEVVLVFFGIEFRIDIYVLTIFVVPICGNQEVLRLVIH